MPEGAEPTKVEVAPAVEEQAAHPRGAKDLAAGSDSGASAIPTWEPLSMPFSVSAPAVVCLKEPGSDRRRALAMLVTGRRRPRMVT